MATITAFVYISFCQRLMQYIGVTWYCLWLDSFGTYAKTGEMLNKPSAS